MSFDDELRTHLEGLEHDGRPEAAPVQRRIDVSELRGHFLAGLRAREHQYPKWVERLHGEWEPLLAPFARYLERLPAHLAPIEEPAARDFAMRCLDRALRWGEPPSLVDRLEIDSIIAGFEKGEDELGRYALENQLVRREPSGAVRTTPLGRVFMRLRGRDAVRWLLVAETAQSRGNWDAFRAPVELLEEALSSEGLTRTQDYEGEEFFPFAKSTLARLSSLGVLVGWVDDPDSSDFYKYEVTAAMRDVVRSAIDPGPWHSAVRALLDDERALATQLPGPSASEATIEQTRMIAHELRNALVPVRHHVDALLAADGLEAHRVRVEATRRGVVRVLEFVDQMVTTSELVTEPSTSVEIGDVIREAVGWVDGGDRVRVEIDPGPLRVDAARARLSRAVLNVVRNALQSATPAPDVRIRARRSLDAIEVAVDDAGPGIPAGSRARVFDDGFTTRPGGTGFGLALVRRVVEGDLRGKVWCEDSDLGGARFVISIPRATATPTIARQE